MTAIFESKLAVSALVWSETQILVYQSVIYLPEGTNSRAMIVGF